MLLYFGYFVYPSVSLRLSFWACEESWLSMFCLRFLSYNRQASIRSECHDFVVVSEDEP